MSIERDRLYMANRTVIRTHRASIRNQQQVRDGLDTLGFAASKLWNVGRWTAQRVWDACGQIPDDDALKSYLKTHERYRDLNAQSSQATLEELDEAFESWYGHRGNGNEKANPPGYRKNGDEHPRSTVTFKEDGFKHDDENGYIRLSKGRNTKDYWADFILCAYDADPDVEIENVQQVRAVYEHGEWMLHIVCRHDIVVESPDNSVAGIDLGICNVATVSFGDESILYPGNVLKENDYYFEKEVGKCDDSASRKSRRRQRKRSERQTHFLHSLSKHIVQQCVERSVGTLVVGDLGGIREDENDDPKNWGRHGNLDLHGWAFDRFTTMLEYKGEEEGIEVVRKDERNTSKTCSVCRTKADSQRVERGLYVCEECGLVANADVNGAENIRQKVKVTPNQRVTPDRSTGWMAQPVVHLFDTTDGRFRPQEQLRCEP
jgi:putative transposase